MREGLVLESTEIIRQAVEEYAPVKVYSLVSGGYDSTVVTHVSLNSGARVDGLVHINTGIGVEQTNTFVREYAQWLNAPLIEKHPPRPYDQIVLEHGFPGPGAHRYMYSWLKERALREVRREAQAGRGGRVVFITGVRTSESTRRMGHVKPIQRDGNTVWVAPILNFTKLDVLDYLDEHGLPKNEVVAMLHMSGECLCGSFSRPGELDEIAFFFPKTAARIRQLEKAVHERGIKSCHWGPQSSSAMKDAPGPLCSGCVYQQVETGEMVAD